jgi:thiamine kinase-like enzyme
MFIDYEYAGYNYRAFDIADHFCEFAGSILAPTVTSILSN